MPSKTFKYKGAPEFFVVPPKVYDLKISAWGAQGGYANSPNASGGRGGFATGFLEVRPCDKLEIRVGGAGRAVPAPDIDPPPPANVFNPPTGGLGGGFNGGGDAQSAITATGAQAIGAGGGGASDVRIRGDRCIVAAGGGGGYRPVNPLNAVPGGAGGGLTGGLSNDDPLNSGGAGTQTTGGVGNASPPLDSGSRGQGGSSVGTNQESGGGGGWFGGGAGYGGGGGSSFIGKLCKGKTRKGVRQGNGLVIIEWNDC
jgi:hypothetical protein